MTKNTITIKHDNDLGYYIVYQPTYSGFVQSITSGTYKIKYWKTLDAAQKWLVNRDMKSYTFVASL